MRELLTATAEAAVRYLEELDERRVGPGEEALAELERFAEPLPEGPSTPEEVVAFLDQVGSPATVAMAGPRYYGFVIGGSLPAALAANWLATAWDQNTGPYRVAPATAFIEQVALDWLIDILELPEGTGGGFVTGATVANFTALAAARNAVLARAGWNVESAGLFDAPPITVVVSAESHPTLFKSLGMLGLGRNRVVAVPTDAQGRMRADALPPIEGPAIICTQAGNVNTGAFDPIGEICERTRDSGAWVHVDGAFGLWAAAAPSLSALASGMAAADSWATDAHKTLNVPYDSGLAFVRDSETLRAAMAITAEYLPTATRRNPSDFTPELSRRARGVDVWAALKQLGRSGVAELVEQCHANARRMADGLAEAGFEILNDVVFNQVLVSFGSPEHTRQVIIAIQADGTSWCGGTEWQGRTAMRISLSSWATTPEDVDRSVAAMVRVARGVADPAAS